MNVLKCILVQKVGFLKYKSGFCGFSENGIVVQRTALIWVVYAARIGNFLPTFRDNLSVPFSWLKESGKPEDEIDRLSLNVGKE